MRERPTPDEWRKIIEKSPGPEFSREERFQLTGFLDTARKESKIIGNTNFIYPTVDNLRWKFERKLEEFLPEQYDEKQIAEIERVMENALFYVERGVQHLNEAQNLLAQKKDVASAESVKNARIAFQQAEEMSQQFENKFLPES